MLSAPRLDTSTVDVDFENKISAGSDELCCDASNMKAGVLMKDGAVAGNTSSARPSSRPVVMSKDHTDSIDESSCTTYTIGTSGWKVKWRGLQIDVLVKPLGVKVPVELLK